MSQQGETFFTSVGCMDGRVQEPVSDFGQEKFGAKYADTITEAGLVGKLAKENLDPNLLESLRFKIVDVSIGKHHSKNVVVSGHQECAGNPVDDVRHKEDIRKSVGIIKSLANSSVPVIGVFVKRSPRSTKSWTVEEL